MTRVMRTMIVVMIKKKIKTARTKTDTMAMAMPMARKRVTDVNHLMTAGVRLRITTDVIGPNEISDHWIKT